MAIDRVLPRYIGFIPPAALRYLQDAVDESPTSDLTVADAIAFTKAGAGDIFLISDTELLGAMFVMYGKSRGTNIMSITLLGGKRFISWRRAIKQYAIDLAKAKNCRSIWIMSGDGWGKIFPDMQRIGSIYSLGVN